MRQETSIKESLRNGYHMRHQLVTRVDLLAQLCLDHTVLLKYMH